MNATTTEHERVLSALAGGAPAQAPLNIPPARLAEVLAVKLDAAERETYHSAAKAIAGLDGKITEVGHGAAKRRVVAAADAVASGTTSPGALSKVGLVDDERARDAARRGALKRARWSVESTAAKALAAVAKRALAAGEALLAGIVSDEQARASALGIPYVPSATAWAVRAAIEPIQAEARRGQAHLDFVRTVVTPAELAGGK